jgi:hypothetical protein
MPEDNKNCRVRQDPHGVTGGPNILLEASS